MVDSGVLIAQSLWECARCQFALFSNPIRYCLRSETGPSIVNQELRSYNGNKLLFLVSTRWAKAPGFRPSLRYRVTRVRGLEQPAELIGLSSAPKYCSCVLALSVSETAVNETQEATLWRLLLWEPVHSDLAQWFMECFDTPAAGPNFPPPQSAHLHDAVCHKLKA